MRAINHALTGALIGLTVNEPLVALPAALLSHVVCDVIPHHGITDISGRVLASKLFRRTLLADAVLCGVLVVLLYLRQPAGWLLAAVCAFAAASPDFLFVNRFIKAQSRQKWQPSRLVAWLTNIQWFQRPIGATVEVAWFIAGIILLLPFLR